MRQDSTHTTIDHHTIRDWAEQRAGYPVHVLGSEGEADAIRVHCPLHSRDSGVEQLERITWDAFFDEFDERRLCFVYQERTPTGRLSHVSRLIHDHGTEPRGPH
jgi:hypothetical protein